MTVRQKGKPKRRIPFELVSGDGEVEEFSIRGVAGWAMVEMLDQMSTDDPLADAKAAGELREFFEEAIGDDEVYARFRAFLRNPDNGFGMDEILNLMRQLAEEATKRPTEPSKSSRPGRAKTSDGSTAIASVKEST